MCLPRLQCPEEDVAADAAAAEAGADEVFLTFEIWWRLMNPPASCLPQALTGNHQNGDDLLGLLEAGDELFNSCM